MALVDHKSGAAAVDPDDHNAVVDAVIALQAGGGAVQPILVARITLTSAWILAHSTDLATQVVVAGDATKQILPLGGVASLAFATTAYAGDGSGDTDILIGFGDPFNDPADILGLPTDMWEATDDAVMPLPQTSVASAHVGRVPGEDLRVYLLGAGLTTGDSDVVVTVAYTTVDLAA